MHGVATNSRLLGGLKVEIPQIYQLGLSGRNPQHFRVKRIARRVMVVILRHILTFIFGDDRTVFLIFPWIGIGDCLMAEVLRGSCFGIFDWCRPRFFQPVTSS